MRPKAFAQTCHRPPANVFARTACRWVDLSKLCEYCSEGLGRMLGQGRHLRSSLLHAWAAWGPLPLLLLLAVQSLASCGNALESKANEVDSVSAQKVLARVNGEEILESHFEQFLHLGQDELGESLQPAVKGELFLEFIAGRLVLQEARKSGVGVEQERIEEYTAEWTSKDGGKIPGLSEQIRDFLFVQKFLSEKVRPGIEVTLPEVQAYYENRMDEFIIEDQAHVLEILTKDRAEAERIRAELREGDTRQFRQMAQKHSIGIAGRSGGDLGFFCRGDLPEEFERVIFALTPGEMNDSPFRSVHGYHIFLMEEWIPRHPQKFFEVQNQIFETLVAEKERIAVEAYLRQLLKNASIEVYDPALKAVLKEESPDAIPEQ